MTDSFRNVFEHLELIENHVKRFQKPDQTYTLGAFYSGGGNTHLLYSKETEINREWIFNPIRFDGEPEMYLDSEILTKLNDETPCMFALLEGDEEYRWFCLPLAEGLAFLHQHNGELEAVFSNLAELLVERRRQRKGKAQ